MANKVAIGVEDLYEFRPVSDPKISPDGKRVVFVQEHRDKKKAFTTLWVVGAEGGEPRALTEGERHDGLPRHHPARHQRQLSVGQRPGAAIICDFSSSIRTQ